MILFSVSVISFRLFGCGCVAINSFESINIGRSFDCPLTEATICYCCVVVCGCAQPPNQTKRTIECDASLWRRLDSKMRCVLVACKCDEKWATIWNVFVMTKYKRMNVTRNSCDLPLVSDEFFRLSNQMNSALDFPLMTQKWINLLGISDWFIFIWVFASERLAETQSNWICFSALFFLIIDDDGVKNYHLLITRRQDNTRIIYNFVISTNHKTFVVLIQFFPFHVSSIRIIACTCIFKWFQSFVCLSKERSSRKCFCSSAFVLAVITEKRNNAKNWQRNCWFFSFFGGDD